MQNLQVRKSAERGYANHGWLQSYHSFSFAEYFDRNHMHFSALRVINDDIIAADRGFGMHPHRDMEIVTYILDGELRHKDSIGNGSVIKAGDVQRMSAGTGIVHSEFNASSETPVHLLQIWIMPDTLDMTPSYEERHFTREEKLNRWRLIAAKNPIDGAIKVEQDIQIYASILESGAELNFTLNANRSAYLHIALGKVEIAGELYSSGDALMLNGAKLLQIKASIETEMLLFDLPLHEELGSAKH
jgi:redox-sensitive bicupin YhaK (pirin superfamily)